MSEPMEPEEILQQPEVQETQHRVANALGDSVEDIVDIGSEAIDLVTDADLGDLASGAAEVATEAASGALEVIGGLLGSIFD